MRHSTAFTVASALQQGASRESIRSLPLDQPFHGIRAPIGAVRDHLDLCLAYALKMGPSSAFAGVSAAILWGLPLPMHLSDIDRVVTSTAIPRRAARGRGVVGLSHDPARSTTAMRDGLRVLSPADTWLSLAEILDLPDLVAVGDAIVTPPFGESEALASVEDLQRGIERHIGGRGVVLARRAVELVRVGALSRPETLYRIACVAAGLPEPIPNFATTCRGRDVMLDGAWPMFRVAWEYDGDHHRGREQFQQDLGRRAAIREDWTLQEIGAAGLFRTLPDTVQRSARMLMVAGWRPSRPIDLTRLPLFHP